MKKSKTFIMGLLLGILITSILPVSAAIEEYVCKRPQYKILVNGEEYSNPKQPVLNYNGTTYFPRAFLESLGFTFEWNGELGQAKVITPLKNDTIKEEGEVNETMYEEYCDRSEGSVIIKGKKYFRTADFTALYWDTDHTFWYNSEDDTLQLVKCNEHLPGIEPEIIINKIPITRFPEMPRIKNLAYLEWEYFVNTILPLITEE